MNKHEAKGWARQMLANRRLVRFSVVARVLVFAAAVTVAGLGYSQYAEAAQSANAYCGQYSGDAQTACKDGIRGADCSDYATIFSGQSNVNSIIDACKSGNSAQQSGQITGGSSSGNNSSDADNAAAYKNAIVLACSQYDDSQQRLACLYGGLGENGDATSPISVADCTNSDAIKKSSNVAQNRAACNLGSTAGQTYLSLQNNKDSTSSNPNSILDQLDQANSLSEYVDVLHASGPNSGTDMSGKSDNDYASYTDGAGNKQSIKVMPCSTNAGSGAADGAAQTVKHATNVNGFKEVTTESGGGGSNCPAIIWLNGGGWHANDGTAYCLATGSSQKNCQAGSDGGGDTGAGDKGAPAGGGANARGYTVIEVAYRLGSSGVYYMFEDVMRGIQHVINNASMYHIDQSKITVGGDSAGGSLAMRAIASGKSGAKVGIGWSPPTNAYTGLFRSYKSLMIGMDHSTCIPTDLAGLTNTTDLLAGGSGDVAQYGEGISSNDFSFGGGATGGGSGGGVSGTDGITNGLNSVGGNLGTNGLDLLQNAVSGSGSNSSSSNGGLGNLNSLLDSNSSNLNSLSDSSSSASSIISSLSSGSGGGTLGTITQVLSAAQYAQDTGKNIETISKQLETAYNNGDPTIDSVMGSGLPSGVFNLSAKKLIECIDNFNSLSPALFASPDSPPAFVAGFDSDDVVGPEQVYGMRDKLQSLGIESKALVIPGDADAGNQALGASDNHLGYDPRFVCETLNFVDHIIDPKKDADQVDCASGKKPSEVAKEQEAAAGSSGGSDSSGNGSNNGNGSGGDCPTGKTFNTSENANCKCPNNLILHQGSNTSSKCMTQGEIDNASISDADMCRLTGERCPASPAKTTCPSGYELHNGSGDDGKCWKKVYTNRGSMPKNQCTAMSNYDHYDTKPNNGSNVTCWTSTWQGPVNPT